MEKGEKKKVLCPHLMGDKESPVLKQILILLPPVGEKKKAQWQIV